MCLFFNLIILFKTENTCTAGFIPERQRRTIHRSDLANESAEKHRQDGRRIPVNHRSDTRRPTIGGLPLCERWLFALQNVLFRTPLGILPSCEKIPFEMRISARCISIGHKVYLNTCPLCSCLLIKFEKTRHPAHSPSPM